MTREEYEQECSLNNAKYQIKGVDAYDYLLNHSKRIIQLPTIAKLSTDNDSICNDFPIDADSIGMEPYNEYVIKVNDTYGTTLYIFVHFKGQTTYLLPVVMGYNSEIPCSPLHFTNNWRTREIFADYIFYPHDGDNQKFSDQMDAFLTNKNRPSKVYAMTSDAQKEFGIKGIMMVIDNNEIYGHNPLLLTKSTKNLIKKWKNSELMSLYDKHTTTTLSSSSLILQVWIYTICLWRNRCLKRQVEIRHSSGKIEKTSDFKKYLDEKKQTIIDINKNIIIYINDNMTKREFKGYHIKESLRCGHFRHLSNGKICYIPPTTVHYKKLVPDEHLVGSGCPPIIYRNTEDFLREKSYLENDVCLMLRAKNIRFNREQTFSWMGRKRLDFYLSEKQIGIECQGVQHFYPYGSKDNDFDSRQKRDVEKYNECNEHGILIIYYVSSEIPIPEDFKKQYLYVTDLNDLYDLVK